MIINCPVVTSTRSLNLKKGAFCQSHDGLFATRDGWSSNHYYNKMPTEGLRKLCKSSYTIQPLQDGARSAEFVTFRDAEIGVGTVNGDMCGFVRHNRGGFSAFKNVQFQTDRHNFILCTPHIYNYNSLWKPSPLSGVKLLDGHNCMLETMIVATKLKRFGKVWKDGFIDFPTDWHWHCPPDGTLNDFTEESALIGSPSLNPANQIVSGVWVNQPLITPAVISLTNHPVIIKIHRLRNLPSHDGELLHRFRDGYSLTSGCSSSLKCHPVLSQLDPTLQWIIRDQTIRAYDSGMLQPHYPDTFVLNEVIDYLKLFTPGMSAPVAPF